MERNKVIVRTGFVGIGANALLSVVKVIIGLISGSVAIILDAVNNMSDALSSVITIIGIKLANKPADKKHPMGYGRIEYLSTMFIAGIILVAGFSSCYESIKKIFNPEKADYSMTTIIIIIAAIVVKLFLGLYTKKMGEKTDSDSLKASGSDALFDAIISFATLVSAFVMIIFKISIDSYLAFIISLVVIKSGIETLRDVLSDLLGSRVSPETSQEIKKEIRKIDGVMGAYDLYLDSYGPERFAGSVHIEVCQNMTATEIDILSRKIQAMVREKFGVVLTCGIYAVPDVDTPNGKIYEQVKLEIKKIPGTIQVHGFHIDDESKRVFFDVVHDFSVKDLDKLRDEITAKVKGILPNYRCFVNFDIDMSD